MKQEIVNFWTSEVFNTNTSLAFSKKLFWKYTFTANQIHAICEWDRRAMTADVQGFDQIMRDLSLIMILRFFKAKICDDFDHQFHESLESIVAQITELEDEEKTLSLGVLYYELSDLYSADITEDWDLIENMTGLQIMER